MDDDSTTDLEFIKACYAKKVYKVSTATLCRWREQGTIKAIKNPSGRYLYGVPKRKIINMSDPHTTQKEKVCYCRVSSNKQKNDLRRQIDFMQSRYPDHLIISDVGSGINWKRSGLKTILGLAMRSQLQEVVVAHRDRLCRFAFDLLKWILEDNQVNVVVLDDDTKSSEQELADDLLSIIHVFSCRQMGKRRYKNKKIITTKESETQDEESENEETPTQ